MKTLTTVLPLIACAVPSYALTFDQNITPDVVFGSGNDNGAFTVGLQNGVELGLRGKLRFDPANMP
ncbi:MAG: hypothetical protein ACI9UQ_000046 [Candidatus Krumholzibacteriia bacterium]|jgi:hypothetical protein